MSILIPPDQLKAKKRFREEARLLTFDGVPEELRTLGQGRSYHIRTYGCQMNEHDTETMAGLLQAMGFQATADAEGADLVLLNTCAIRENAEDKVFGEIGRFKPIKVKRPEVILGVCGCMAQEEGVVNRILQKHPQVDLIFGTHNIHRLPHLLREAYFSKEMVVEVWSKEGDVVENLPKVRQDGVRGWVNIMYGCDKFCTYCIVPYTRGKERSRHPRDVWAEVREMARQGYQEVTLLGQNVNAYGKDLADSSYRFADLLADLSRIDIPRIRFTTSHPRDFDDRLIDVLSTRGNLVEHIHLPVQSGSSAVLQRMARKYTREEYLGLVERIRHAIPDVALTTDIIVGFPGESEEQFAETLSLVQEVQYDSAYTFIYSPRDGTPAAKYADNVAPEVKKERLYRLNEALNRISLEKNRLLQGQVVEVLVEGVSKSDPEHLSGRTRTNKLVHFPGEKSLVGRLLPVRITQAQTWTLKGELPTAVEVKQA